MKRLRDKVRRIRMMRWSKLTLGEKIARVIFNLLKIAAIAAIAVTVASVAVAVVIGVAVAFGIASAIAGGFNYVGYDEYIVRIRR